MTYELDGKVLTFGESTAATISDKRIVIEQQTAKGKLQRILLTPETLKELASQI